MLRRVERQHKHAQVQLLHGEISSAMGLRHYAPYCPYLNNYYPSQILHSCAPSPDLPQLQHTYLHLTAQKHGLVFNQGACIMQTYCLSIAGAESRRLCLQHLNGGINSSQFTGTHWDGSHSNLLRNFGDTASVRLQFTITIPSKSKESVDLQPKF